MRVPAVPPIGQILARLAFHRPEEVRGLRVAIGPGGDEPAEGGVEAVRPQDLFAQQHKAQRRLEIGDRVPPLFDHRIRAGQDRRRGGIGQDGEDLVDRIAATFGIFAVALGRIFAAVEIVRLIDVDERVEALVHPRMPPFVEADDHRKPIVPDLMRGDPEQFLARIFRRIEHDAGIFHSARRARDIDRGRPGIGIPAGREALDRILHIFGRSAPARGSGAFGGVIGHGERGLAVRQADTRCIPGKGGRGRKRNVARILHAIMPGQRAGVPRP